MFNLFAFVALTRSCCCFLALSARLFDMPSWFGCKWLLPWLGLKSGPNARLDPNRQ